MSFDSAEIELNRMVVLDDFDQSSDARLSIKLDYLGPELLSIDAHMHFELSICPLDGGQVGEFTLQ